MAKQCELVTFPVTVPKYLEEEIKGGAASFGIQTSRMPAVVTWEVWRQELVTFSSTAKRREQRTDRKWGRNHFDDFDHGLYYS